MRLHGIQSFGWVPLREDWIHFKLLNTSAQRKCFLTSVTKSVFALIFIYFGVLLMRYCSKGESDTFGFVPVPFVFLPLEYPCMYNVALWNGSVNVAPVDILTIARIDSVFHLGLWRLYIRFLGIFQRHDFSEKGYEMSVLIFPFLSSARVILDGIYQQVICHR